MVALEEKTLSIEKTCKDVSVDFDYLCDDCDELEGVVENMDNAQRRDNIKLRGVKKGVEGRDLVKYLGELFSGWNGSDCKPNINIALVFCIGSFKGGKDIPDT